MSKMVPDPQISQVPQPERKKVRKGINGFAMLFCVLVIVAVLTYILPAGQFDREDFNGREMIVPGSYHLVESSPANPFSIFSSIHEGMVQAAPIIFYVFIIGGMFNVVNSTGAIDTLLRFSAKRLSKQRFIFIAGLMLVFSVGGSALGMGEESLIYIPLVVPIALALGYDVFTGAAIVLMGMSIGFTSAALNPFTIGIAQSIAGLPMFSGIGPRLVMHGIMLALGVAFIYRYAEKVRKDPSRGFFVEDLSYNIPDTDGTVVFETKHKLVLSAFLITLLCIIFGAIKYEWYLAEMSACFIILSIVVGIIGRMSVAEYMKNFLQGSANLIAGALIIGLAKSITVVLASGNILDTILNGASGLMENAPTSLTVVCMFLVQEFIHFLVPSSSGQAMLTMPIMLPLADLLHITRQTSCFIFTLADGVGSVFFPTSGYFMAAIGIVSIPYGQWVKRIWPLIVTFYAVGMIASIIAAKLNYGPF